MYCYVLWSVVFFWTSYTFAHLQSFTIYYLYSYLYYYYYFILPAVLLLYVYSLIGPYQCVTLIAAVAMTP